MNARTLREVNAPYTVNPDDEALGRDTIIIHRDGKPVAALVPYAEYQQWLAAKAASAPTPTAPDTEFERNRAAFQRLLPELLKTHRGQWVAIVNEQLVQFGPDFKSVIVPVRERFGQQSVYVHEIVETPRVSNQRATPYPRTGQAAAARLGR